MSNRDSSARGSAGPTEGALELRLRRDAASWRLEPSRGLSQRVLAGIGPAAAPRRRGVVRVLAAAASILLAIGLALYLPPAAPAPTGSEQLSRILPTLTSYLGEYAQVLRGALDGPLLAELQAFSIDAGNAADGFIERLPKPLRGMGAVARGQ